MSRFDSLRPVSHLKRGVRGIVRRIVSEPRERSERLMSLGVTPGAAVTVLQTFPGVVFECDQTELAVEPAVAGAILVEVLESA